MRTKNTGWERKWNMRLGKDTWKGKKKEKQQTKLKRRRQQQQQDKQKTTTNKHRIKKLKYPPCRVVIVKAKQKVKFIIRFAKSIQKSKNIKIH